LLACGENLGNRGLQEIDSCMRGFRARTTDPYFSPPVQKHRGEPDTRDRHTNLTNHLITSKPTPLTDSARARPHPEQLTLNHTRTPGDARVATNHRSTPLTRKRGGGDGEGNGAQAGEQRGSSSPWRLHHSPLVPQNSKIALCGSTNFVGGCFPLARAPRPLHPSSFAIRKVCLHERTFETFGWVVPSVDHFCVHASR